LLTSICAERRNLSYIEGGRWSASVFIAPLNNPQHRNRNHQTRLSFA
jgi:hypothetical protein